MNWKVLSSKIPQDQSELRQVLLENREITSETSFFSPKHPMDITLEEVEIDAKQMAKTVARLLEAKEKKQDVIVFGDYDADGVCATAVLWETLYELGVKARPFIPNREKHGYGMTDRSLTDLLAEKIPDVIISVDTGIVALDAVEMLNAKGIDVIITDHHVPEVATEIHPQGALPDERFQIPVSKNKRTDNGLTDQQTQPKSDQPLAETNYRLPSAFSIVHSTKLCGTTVAWFLARELNRDKASTMLDLCGIATIADQMVLLDANRSFAKFGVQALKTSDRIGIQNLCQVAGVEQKDIVTRTVNYALAPRINAMGRLGSALDALRALCTHNQEKSLELIQKLHTTNTERQSLTWDMVDEAKAQAEDWKDEHLIVVASTEYHEGVIGLIAGKLVEEFYKPAIAISIGETFAKASARSVDGVNIVELIREVRDDLLEVGGHPMAAGFGLEPAKVEVVKQRLLKLAKEQIDKSLLTSSLTVDCILPLEIADLDSVETIEQFDPFGNGNPEPVFGIKDVILEKCYAVGNEKKHLKLQVGSEGSESSGNVRSQMSHVSLHCIGFGLGHLESKLEQGQTISIAGTLSLNEWNGRKSVQMIVKDVNTVNS